jgi:uncharacterized membrane protein
VVAIAITLLVFNLKIEHATGSHLTFGDAIQPWIYFLVFVLSFFNIAHFWRVHHAFIAYFKKPDEKLLSYNIFWPFFIITLPFITSLVSAYFSDTPAIFIYRMNIFLITRCQSMIWDYASLKPEFPKETKIEKETIDLFRVFCNLDMVKPCRLSDGHLSIQVRPVFSFSPRFP